MSRVIRYTDHSVVTARRYDRPREECDPYTVYNDLPAFRIEPDTTPPAATRRQADTLFDTHVRPSPNFKPYKVAEKQAYFGCLIHAGQKAMHSDGCVMLPRNINHPECTKAGLQVADAAVASGLFREVRSPRGSPRMTRLLPLSKLQALPHDDPAEFDPDTRTSLVTLKDRSTGRELPIDWTHPVAADCQARLGFVNRVNASFRITYQAWSEWDDSPSVKQLRPVHSAVFTGDFAHQGRLYSARHGHQSLSKRDRMSIEFDGEPCVELDYSGMHCRMMYHSLGMECPKDPYQLWGPTTTGQQRHLAKTVVVTAINARSRDSAIAACNSRLRTFNDVGKRKTGRDSTNATRLGEAIESAGTTFRAVYDLAVSRHAAVAHLFGKDMGMKLMRLDGAIALDVLHHFASEFVPCLGVHDSFIIPASYAGELKRTMMSVYHQRLGHLPVVKKAGAGAAFAVGAEKFLDIECGCRVPGAGCRVLGCFFAHIHLTQFNDCVAPPPAPPLNPA